jgi:hypothetical protein
MDGLWPWDGLQLSTQRLLAHVHGLYRIPVAALHQTEHYCQPTIEIPLSCRPSPSWGFAMTAHPYGSVSSAYLPRNCESWP